MNENGSEDRVFDECGTLDYPGSPGGQTIQNLIQRLVLAGHLENKYDAGRYAFVSDPARRPMSSTMVTRLEKDVALEVEDHASGQSIYVLRRIPVESSASYPTYSS